MTWGGCREIPANKRIKATEHKSRPPPTTYAALAGAGDIDQVAEKLLLSEAVRKEKPIHLLPDS